MVWTVLGEGGLSFRVDESGLSISGDGRQVFRPAATIEGWSAIEPLPARWEIHRASEASETANLISLEVSTLKHHLDAAAVKVTTSPISIIKFSGWLAERRHRLWQEQYNVPIEEEHQAHSGQHPRADRPDGDMARDQNLPPYCAFFSTFLPDAYFDNVWKVAKLITSHSEMSYQIRFGFDGFMPRKAPDHPDLISCQEWLDGRPCISTEGFAFMLEPIRKEKLEEKYSFDPTQTGI
jgi:hypothetical protein